MQARKVIPYSRLKAGVTHLLNALAYKCIFKHVNVFLARTELVKDSLIQDYGIAENKIIVTYLPNDNIQRNPSQTKSNPLQLLFVCNDWERKGGKFLCSRPSNYT